MPFNLPPIIGLGTGGGFEYHFIPEMTGVDVMQCYFSLVTERINRFDAGSVNRDYPFGSVNFLFCEPGRIQEIVVPEEMNGKIFASPGDVIGEIVNATSRVGYFLVRAKTRDDYLARLSSIDDHLKITDTDGNDMLYHRIYD